MSDLGFNVWGSITGVIGLVTGLPALACWLYSQMPTYNMRILDQLLAETEVVFDSAIKGGLLHGGNGLHRFNLKIWDIQVRVDDLRGEVYTICSWREEVRLWSRGRTSVIKMLCKQLRDLRVRLARNSSRERRELAAAGYLNRLAECPNDVRDRLLNTFAAPPYRDLPYEPTASRRDHGAAPSKPPPAYESDSSQHTSGIVARLPSPSSCCTPQGQHANSIPPPLDDANSRTRPSCTDDRLGGIKISERDLEDLVAYLATHLDQPAEETKRLRATRKELLQRFGRHLSKTSLHAISCNEPQWPRRAIGMSRVKVIKQVVRGRLGRKPDRLRSPTSSVDAIRQSRHALASYIPHLSSGNDSNDDQWNEE